MEGSSARNLRARSHALGSRTRRSRSRVSIEQTLVYDFPLQFHRLNCANETGHCVRDQSQLLNTIIGRHRFVYVDADNHLAQPRQALATIALRIANHRLEFAVSDYVKSADRPGDLLDHRVAYSLLPLAVYPGLLDADTAQCLVPGLLQTGVCKRLDADHSGHCIRRATCHLSPLRLSQLGKPLVAGEGELGEEVLQFGIDLGGDPLGALWVVR